MISRKILLLGEMGVGKTSIARRLKFNTFGDRYKATIGADIYAYEVVPPPLGIAFEFLIWDTDGSYGEGVFRQYYAQQAQAAMIVSDATRPSTLDTMITLGRMFADVLPGRYFAHILNKMDAVEDGVAEDMIMRLQTTKVPLYTTSALTGDNVTSAFAKAAVEIIKLER
jgi:small GTP-binding protein